MVGTQTCQVSIGLMFNLRRGIDAMRSMTMVGMAMIMEIGVDIWGGKRGACTQSTLDKRVHTEAGYMSFRTGREHGWNRGAR